MYKCKVEKPKSKQLEEARKKYKVEIRSGLITYDPVFDSYYFTETNEWAEPKCGDDECRFCANRPDKHVSHNVEVRGRPLLGDPSSPPG